MSGRTTVTNYDDEGNVVEVGQTSVRRPQPATQAVLDAIDEALSYSLDDLFDDPGLAVVPTRRPAFMGSSS